MVSSGRDAEGAAVPVSNDPSPAKRESQNGRSQRTSQMRSALTPIQAAEREPSSQRRRGRHVNAQSFERDLTRCREMTGRVGTGRDRQPAERQELVEERD